MPVYSGCRLGICNVCHVQGLSQECLHVLGIFWGHFCSSILPVDLLSKACSASKGALTYLAIMQLLMENAQ